MYYSVIIVSTTCRYYILLKYDGVKKMYISFLDFFVFEHALPSNIHLVLLNMSEKLFLITLLLGH